MGRARGGAQAVAATGFNTLFGARRGGVREPEAPASGPELWEDEPDLGYDEPFLTSALEADYEAGDRLLWRNYNTRQTLAEMSEHPLRHVYIEARYSGAGELIALATYAEIGISNEAKTPQRVLYHGKDPAELAAKLAAADTEMTGAAEPLTCHNEKRAAGETNALYLTRKVLRIAADRRRIKKLLGT